MLDGMRVYIAGPMESAGGNWNLPLFDYVAAAFRSKGAEVFNPADRVRKIFGSVENIQALDKATRRKARLSAMKVEINWIMDEAQLVYLLPGWEHSPGALAERQVALAFGKTIREAPDTILINPNAEWLEPQIE